MENSREYKFCNTSFRKCINFECENYEHFKEMFEPYGELLTSNGKKKELPNLCCHKIEDKSSFLIYFAGRYFLYGLDGLTKLQEDKKLFESIEHLHIIISHIIDEKYIDILNDVKFNNYTYWTSDWILDEFLDNKIGVFQDLQFRTAENAESSYNNNESINKCIITFEEEMKFNFGYGISLEIGYFPNSNPSLYASFIYNEKPFNFFPINEEDYNKKYLGIKNKEIDTQTIFWQLKYFPERIYIVNSHIRKLKNLISVNKSSIELREYKLDNRIWYAPQMDVIATLKKKNINNFKDFGNFNTDFSKIKPFTNNVSNNDGKITPVFGIFCGSVYTASEKEPLHPGRKIEALIKKINGKGEGQYKVVSILHWRLHEIIKIIYDEKERFDKNNKQPLQILLTVTPDTINDVRNEIIYFPDYINDSKTGCHIEFGESKRKKDSSYLINCRKEPDKNKEYDFQIEISLLKQTLVTKYNTCEADEINNKNIIKHNGDKGWRLYNKGHYETINLIKQYFGITNKSTIPENMVCFIFAHNNLGDLINTTTLKYMQEFNKSEKALSVEVLKLDTSKLNNHTKKRLGYLLYNKKDKNYYLAKGHYRKEMEIKVDKEMYFSTHSWYLKLNLLADVKTTNEEYYLLPDGSNNYLPRMDLEFIVNQNQDKFNPIDISKTKLTIEDYKTGLYKNRRYLAVRNEYEVCNEDFIHSFTKTFVKDKINDSIIVKPLIKPEYVPQYKVWGSTELLKLKGATHKTNAGETFEISTDPSGVCKVLIENGYLPLSRVLSKFIEEGKDYSLIEDNKPDGSAATNNFTIMAKYLDCHGPLSVQIHPDKETASALKTIKDISKHSNYYSDKNIKDDRGKEESFYVLKAAPKKAFHLFLGFNRTEMEPIAEALRDTLHYQYHFYEFKDKSEDVIIDNIIETVVNKIVDVFQKKEIYLSYGNEKKVSLIDFILQSLELNDEVKQNISKGIDEIFKSNAEIKLAIKYHVNKKAIIENWAEKHNSIQNIALEDLVNFNKQEATKKNTNTHEKTKVNPDGQNISPAEFDKQKAIRAKFLGKEYLFACLGIIWLNKIITEIINKKELTNKANCLYEYSREFDPNKSILLRFYNRVTVKPDQIIRIPPGVVHSWQGGGNLLIEISHRTDSTLRILDFGREINKEEKNRRDMHYTASMFSLSEQSIFDYDRNCFNKYISSVTLNTQESDDQKNIQTIHPKINIKNIESKEQLDWNEITVYNKNQQKDNENLQKDFCFIMNPDGDLRLQNSNNMVAIKQCNCVIIAPHKTETLRYFPEHFDNRVLFFYPYTDYKDYVVIVLREDYYECIILKDVSIHRSFKEKVFLADDYKKMIIPNVKTNNSKDILDVIAEKIKSELNTDSNPAYYESREIYIGISWPGPYNEKEKKLYSSFFPHPYLKSVLETKFCEIAKPYKYKNLIIEIRQDLEIILHGEFYHNLGRLKYNQQNESSKAAMVLNIEEGICFGFNTEALKVENGGQENENEITKINAIARIGRWIYINPCTGELKTIDELKYFYGNKKEAKYKFISNHIFEGQLDVYEEKNGGPGFVRISKYFSIAGIIKNSGLNKRELLYSTESSYEKDRVIIQIANEIAKVIKLFQRKVFELDFSETTKEFLINSTKKIVLTGKVGRFFSKASKQDIFEDLFIATLKRSLADNTKIFRSEISHKSDGALEGFLKIWEEK